MIPVSDMISRARYCGSLERIENRSFLKIPGFRNETASMSTP
ncbi:hypothetical protein LCGC14_2750470, partial [marine sediment metagenome]